MQRLVWFLAGAIALIAVVCLCGFIFLKTGASSFSARTQPSALETLAARQARAMAMPANARERANPIADSAEVMADVRAHWADHCAACHANNGSGDTEMGKHMYPPAPDMREPDTQTLSDGELFYIIQNGIRLTGMPAWGSGSEHDNQDSWSLVRFIRHLPKLTAEEEAEMKEMNPKSPDELKEEQEERDFLNGDQTREHAQHEHH
jgi:mono/diheme cytochrome c family protein